tara:strand:+ start:1612 stop:1950 length:339 start_codon:yes stop_codon:yes gene_type:complete
MPVLGGDDHVIAAFLDQAVGHRHHLVALRHRQVAARAEAVLDVDQQQGLHDLLLLVPTRLIKPEADPRDNPCRVWSSEWALNKRAGKGHGSGWELSPCLPVAASSDPAREFP